VAFQFVHNRAIELRTDGSFPEPPVYARFGPTSDETKVARVGGIHAIAARLQALSTCHLFKHEHEADSWSSPTI
jgi:hypothetical protein